MFIEIPAQQVRQPSRSNRTPKATDSQVFGIGKLGGMRREVMIAVAASLFVVFSVAAWASCTDDYEDAVQQCQATYNDPDDADYLAQCVQEAKDDFVECVGK